MDRKKRDNLSYYEVYNQRGDLVVEGDKHMIAERLGLSVKHVARSAKIGMCNGLEYILVGKSRRIFDCHEGTQYIMTGTYEEIAERTGNRLATVKFASNPSANKRGDGRVAETNMLLLYEHDDREVRYL